MSGNNKIMYFISKQPAWSTKYNGYFLDFEGRVTSPSIKNFQLVDPSSGKGEQ